MDRDTEVKLYIYQALAETGVMPDLQAITTGLGLSPDTVQAAFSSLHAQRLLVPEPGDPTRIRMAPPFSGMETPFRVQVGETSFYANCIWDALGVPAAMHRDGVVYTSDGHDREALVIPVEAGRPVSMECVVHFAVPAARWWEDIIYT